MSQVKATPLWLHGLKPMKNLLDQVQRLSKIDTVDFANVLLYLLLHKLGLFGIKRPVLNGQRSHFEDRNWGFYSPLPQTDHLFLFSLIWNHRPHDIPVRLAGFLRLFWEISRKSWVQGQLLALKATFVDHAENLYKFIFWLPLYKLLSAGQPKLATDLHKLSGIFFAFSGHRGSNNSNDNDREDSY